MNLLVPTKSRRIGRNNIYCASSQFSCSVIMGADNGIESRVTVAKKFDGRCSGTSDLADKVFPNSDLAWQAIYAHGYCIPHFTPWCKHCRKLHRREGSTVNGHKQMPKSAWCPVKKEFIF